MFYILYIYINNRISIKNFTLYEITLYFDLSVLVSMQNRIRTDLSRISNIFVSRDRIKSCSNRFEEVAPPQRLQAVSGTDPSVVANPLFEPQVGINVVAATAGEDNFFR